MFFRDHLLLKVKLPAFQMATIKKLPILYLVQDNEWDISAHSSETRAVDVSHYAKGFGLETYTIDGTNFPLAYKTIKEIFSKIRKELRFTSCEGPTVKSSYIRVRMNGTEMT